MKRQRFRIRYSPFKGTLLRLFLLPQRMSYVDVRGDEVRVRMGWGFSARLPRAAITDVSREKRIWVTAGAHGWRGRWLVNGASGPIVGIRVDPPARGRVIGVPIEVREVQVSVEDPDALIAALR
jgi:hypothetical protein